MDIRISITGLDDLQKKLDNLKHFETTAAQVIDNYLDRVEATAKGTAPVKTGFLRDNIRKVGIIIARDMVMGELISAAEYSSYVEDRKPFLEPALQEHIESLMNELKEALTVQL